MNNFRSFLQLNQVKMNNFNDYVYHFLQRIQVKRNNFNYYVCDLLQLIDIFLHAKLAQVPGSMLIYWMVYNILFHLHVAF